MSGRSGSHEETQPSRSLRSNRGRSFELPSETKAKETAQAKEGKKVTGRAVRWWRPAAVQHAWVIIWTKRHWLQRPNTRRVACGGLVPHKRTSTVSGDNIEITTNLDEIDCANCRKELMK